MMVLCRHNADGLVATLRPEWPKDFCSIPTRGKVYFLCSKPPASYLTDTGPLLSEVTQPGSKAGQLLQCISDVKNAW